MGKKRTTLSDQIRAAVESCGKSRYQICKDTGIHQAALSRFMAGTGITTSTLDKLAEYLGLEITVRPESRTKGK
jgi:transcriptional regulator with XRE-family HTH domain